MLNDTLELPFAELNAKTKYCFSSLYSHLVHQLNRHFQWLTPGLLVKRWLIVNFIGILLTTWGLVSFLFQLIFIQPLFTFFASLITAISPILPNYLWGTILIILGLGLTYWGQTKAMRSIVQVLKPENNQSVIEMLLSYRSLKRGPKIVAIGGGTGLSNLLRGLKQYSNNLTAIVTVADDGGSSGRLREEFGVLPPGDIRNCITALAQEEGLLTDLFQYRFQTGEGLKGHSFGNLFLTAMSEITGSLEKAIAASSKVLAVQGQVLPATLNDVRLWAELDQGQRVEGESKIASTKGQINKIGCIPANPKALPATIKAIEAADYIILGPGSLYTSIIPNLLVPEIREAIAKAEVPRIYVCNIMTQPGETDDYSVSDHIKAIDNACGAKLFDSVLVNQKSPSPEALSKYAQEESHLVTLDRQQIVEMGREIILANLLDENPLTHSIRHNTQNIGQELLVNSVD